ncbi:hypothetical protein NY78_1815 [Desulfovibrio sp. TomC]|nr:hypothetical protein NY78_1815 [Desulfovibrio sp. TomC]
MSQFFQVCREPLSGTSFMPASNSPIHTLVPYFFNCDDGK